MEVIPEAAVEVAADALVASKLGDYSGINGEEFVEAARAALEAAAPHMEAHALREAADALEDAAQWSAAPNPEFEKIRRWLLSRASSFERPTP